MSLKRLYAAILLVMPKAVYTDFLSWHASATEYNQPITVKEFLDWCKED